MKTLVFVLVILEGTQIYDESLQYGSIDKCNWYANKINFTMRDKQETPTQPTANH